MAVGEEEKGTLVSRCLSAGTQVLGVLNFSLQIKSINTMKNFPFWRCVLSFVCGFIIVGICLVPVANGAATSFYVRYSRIRTQKQLQYLVKFVENERRENGELPNSLGSQFSLDGWGKPIIYQKRGEKYLLISYGADGKPGGRGFDCDLTNENPNPPEAKLSRWENLTHPLSRGMNLAALICGLVVAALVFGGIRDESLKRERWVTTAVGLFITLLAASVVSLFISVFHVPSGH